MKITENNDPKTSRNADVTNFAGHTGKEKGNDIYGIAAGRFALHGSAEEMLAMCESLITFVMADQAKQFKFPTERRPLFNRIMEALRKYIPDTRIGAKICAANDIMRNLFTEHGEQTGEYLVISIKNTGGTVAFWRPDCKGYTHDITQAGRYTEFEIKQDPGYFDNGETTLAVPLSKFMEAFPLTFAAENHIIKKLIKSRPHEGIA